MLGAWSTEAARRSCRTGHFHSREWEGFGTLIAACQSLGRGFQEDGSEFITAVLGRRKTDKSLANVEIRKLQARDKENLLPYWGTPALEQVAQRGCIVFILQYFRFLTV